MIQQEVKVRHNKAGKSQKKMPISIKSRGRKEKKIQVRDLKSEIWVVLFKPCDYEYVNQTTNIMVFCFIAF